MRIAAITCTGRYRSWRSGMMDRALDLIDDTVAAMDLTGARRYDVVGPSLCATSAESLCWDTDGACCRSTPVHRAHGRQSSASWPGKDLLADEDGAADAGPRRGDIAASSWKRGTGRWAARCRGRPVLAARSLLLSAVARSVDDERAIDHRSARLWGWRPPGCARKMEEPWGASETADPPLDWNLSVPGRSCWNLALGPSR